MTEKRLNCVDTLGYWRDADECTEQFNVLLRQSFTNFYTLDLPKNIFSYLGSFFAFLFRFFYLPTQSVHVNKWMETNEKSIRTLKSVQKSLSFACLELAVPQLCLLSGELCIFPYFAMF